MSKTVWYNPSTWVSKAVQPFTRRFGAVYANFFGGLNTKSDYSQTYFIDGHERNDVVYSITTHISDGVGKARWYLKDKRTGKEVYNKHFDNLLQKASPDGRTFSEVLQEGVKQGLISGDSYYTGEVGRGVNRNKYSFVYYLPSDEMRINGSPRGIVSYTPNAVYGNEQIPASDVVHIKKTNPVVNTNDSTRILYGQSPLMAVRDSIKTYNESKAASYYFTKNKGAQKALLLEENFVLGLEGENDEKDKQDSQIKGSANNGNIPILEGVKGVIDISSDPQKALVLEQRLQAAQEICNVYQFPSQLIGIKNTTYQNAKEAKKAKWENCIIPELEAIKTRLGYWLVSKNYGNNLELCYDISHIDALQEDKLMRGKSIKEYAGMVSINEARAFAGLGPIDQLGDFKGTDMYVGFVQSVFGDNTGPDALEGQTDEQEQEGANREEAQQQTEES